MGLKNWLVPTISFIAFLYVMALLGIWTYRSDANKPLFTQESSGNVTNIQDFQRELNKAINR